MTLETLFRVFLVVSDRRLIRVESFLFEHIHRDHFSVYDCVSGEDTSRHVHDYTDGDPPDHFRFLPRVGIFEVIKVRVECIYGHSL